MPPAGCPRPVLQLIPELLPGKLHCLMLDMTCVRSAYQGPLHVEGIALHRIGCIL